MRTLILAVVILLCAVICTAFGGFTLCAADSGQVVAEAASNAGDTLPAMGRAAIYFVAALGLCVLFAPIVFDRLHAGRLYSKSLGGNLVIYPGDGGPGIEVFLDSGASNASDDNTGLSWDQACATLDGAVGKCTASRGDRIIVAARHAEDLAAADAADLDVAGIHVIGLGHGDMRPTFTYTNAAGEIVIGADNVRISNIICNASVTTVLTAIDIETTNTGAIIDNCRFGVDTAGTDEFNNAITVGDQCNGYIIENCEFHQGAAAAVSAIKIDADTDYGTIRGNFVTGDYSTACIVGDEQDDMIRIEGNTLYNGQVTGIGLNTEPCIELHANTTGVIKHNICICNLATKAAAIVAADCHLHESYYNEDESSAGSSGIIGTASDDDA